MLSIFRVIREVTSSRRQNYSKQYAVPVNKMQAVSFNTSMIYLKGKRYLSRLSRSEILLVVQSLFPCHPPGHIRVIENIWLSNEGCENNTKTSVKTSQKERWGGWGERGRYVHYGTIQFIICYFEHIFRVLKKTREQHCFGISECATHSPLPHPASLFASPQARDL